MAKDGHGNLLAPIARVWKDVRPELESDSGEAVDGQILDPEELKKVTKWLQHAVTKLGASASLAEGAERQALPPMAAEVAKAATAALGTLLSLRRGAGASLRAELVDAGAGIASTAEALGEAVTNASAQKEVPLAVGKFLDRAKNFERLSTQNRAAIRRRLLRCLTQLRDVQRELQEALKSGEDGDDDDEDLDDDLGGGFDDSLEPEERRVVEALATAVSALEEALKEASQACAVKTAAPVAGVLPLAELEAAATQSASACVALDSLATRTVGGLEPEAVSDLEKLREAAHSLAGVSEGRASAVKTALDSLQEALDAALKDNA